MAIYHLSVQVVSRGAGRSCVAAAAYRSGEKLEDERQGCTHDYTRRHDVQETWIQAPEAAPAWVTDRQALWTAVDVAEKRKDAQTAREVNLALPRELTPAQQREAVGEFVQAAFVERGMVADVALHEGHDDHEPNPHAHILLTTRTITSEGFGAKNRDWNAKALLVNWRTQWEITCNETLAEAGQSVHIDARSLADQGLDRMPTVHEGPAVRQRERRGLRTERGDRNRAVAQHQAVGEELAVIRQERERLQPLHDAAETRRAQGWPEPHVAAVQAYEEQMGQVTTWSHIQRARATMQAATDQARAAWQRADTAKDAAHATLQRWEQRETAQTELAARKTVGGWVRRVVSPVARKQYQYWQTQAAEANPKTGDGTNREAAEARYRQAKAEADAKFTTYLQSRWESDAVREEAFASYQTQAAPGRPLAFGPPPGQSRAELERKAQQPTPKHPQRQVPPQPLPPLPPTPKGKRSPERQDEGPSLGR